MDAIVVAFVALLLIILVLLMPSGVMKHDAAQHEQTIADMQQVSDAAKAQITQIHRAYRVELARATKARATITRRRP